MDGAPLAVFLTTGSFICVNRISPICFGEPRLNGCPAASKAAASSAIMRWPSSALCAPSRAASISTPLRSIFWSTTETGISMFSYTYLSPLAASSCGCILRWRRSVTSASSAAYSVARWRSIWSKPIWLAPLPQTSS
ncbi:hypothetical protein D3C86_1492470 [compost metagenome]